MDGKIGKNPFVSKYDRNTLIEVRDQYGTLRDFIQGLSNKLSSVSGHIEDEFLSAYRVHMLTVQQELRDLKMQVVKAEEALNEDRQVATLEQEVTWFSDEATRLKNQTASMKKDMQHIVVRTNALREQRMFLSEQLKSTLKRSRILEAELKDLSGNQFENENTSTATPAQSAQQSRGVGISQALNVSASAPNLNKKVGKARGLSKSASSSSKLPILKTNSLKASSIIDDVLIPKSKIASSSMQFAALSVVEELALLKATRVDTEAGLEDAIRGVLREIMDRKVTTAARDMRISMEDAKKAKPKLADIGGITGLGLEHFSDSDRLSAISIFISQPATFRAITKYLSNEI
jgi:hypothetical protein